MTTRKSHEVAKHSEGSLTEAFGKLTGDKEVEAKGASKKREAEVTQSVDTAKKAVEG